jgi:hypothetical protein
MTETGTSNFDIPGLISADEREVFIVSIGLGDTGPVFNPGSFTLSALHLSQLQFVSIIWVLS